MKLLYIFILLFLTSCASSDNSDFDDANIDGLRSRVLENARFHNYNAAQGAIEMQRVVVDTPVQPPVVQQLNVNEQPGFPNHFYQIQPPAYNPINIPQPANIDVSLPPPYMP